MAADSKNPLSEGSWIGRISACRAIKRELLTTWRDNVSYRKGQPFKSMPSDDTVNVPADWSRTKNKQSQLFYQVPEILLQPRRPEFASATSVFQAALNFELVERVHPEFMMNECLGDVINASGIAICKVGYEATFEDVDLGGENAEQPGMDVKEGEILPNVGEPQIPEVPGGGGGVPPPVPPPPPTQGLGAPIQSQIVSNPIYECFYTNRISPAHFLWPVEFRKSDWQKAPWLGWEAYMPLAEAKRLKWVSETAKGVNINDSEWLLSTDGTDKNRSTDSFIKYSEIFYRPSEFDPQEKDPRKIKRLVIVEEGGDGPKKKVIDEDFQWQRYDPMTRKWIGMTSFPIKVVTISYISDQAIPPSDSEMGRPQVKELIRARSQMMRQREHSLPLRWFDVNMVDDMIADRLRKGKFQDMIPMNGPGDKAIGEVARAQYPVQNFEFDKVARQDLDEAWSMGPAQQSQPTPGDTTAAEIKAMDSSMSVRLDFERSWILRFFVEVAMGVADLMQMFCDKEDYVYVLGVNGEKSLQAWNKDTVAGEYIFEAKPDSQLRLDVNQKRNEALNLYKLLRKDPLINPTGLVQELLELHGLDPAKSLAPPAPPQPEKPKVSYSFKGEDMVNPMVVAIMQKSDTPITAQDIQAAQQLLASVAAPVAPPMGQPLPQGTPEGPTGASPEHPGVPEVVQPLDRRFERSGTSVEGSRDSSKPTSR